MRREPGIKPGDSGEINLAESTEEQLRREVEELRRRLREKDGHISPPANSWHPSGVAIWAIFLAVAILLAIAFFAGYIPLQKRNSVLAGEARDFDQSLPRAEVVEVS